MTHLRPKAEFTFRVSAKGPLRITLEAVVPRLIRSHEFEPSLDAPINPNVDGRRVWRSLSLGTAVNDLVYRLQ